MPGDSSSATGTTVQTLLKNGGYYDGPINGVWNADTRKGLARWQDEMGLAPTGVWDLASEQKFREIISYVSGASLLPADVSEETLKEVETRYGPGFVAMLSHPELGPIIIQAAEEGRDDVWIKAQWQNTDYFNEMDRSQRAWEELKLNDPREAEAQLDGAMDIVGDRASQLGLDLAPWQIRQIADDAHGRGWLTEANVGLLDNLLVSIITTFGAEYSQAGTFAAKMQDVANIAAEYGYDIHPTKREDWAGRLLTGETNEDAIRNHFIARAKANMPWLAEALDTGVTVAEYVDPLVRAVASLLEVSPDSIDWIHQGEGKWHRLLEFKDPDTGQFRAMTRTEAETAARRTDRWKLTQNYRDTKSEMDYTLAQFMGVLG